MTTSTLSNLITRRIDELRSRKSRKQVALEAGLEQSTLDLIASGKAKLPLDFALPLARALDCEARSFLASTLRQFVADEFVDVLLADDEREGKDANVNATMTAVGVELVNLREDLKSVEHVLGDAQERLSGMAHTFDRLIKETADLAGVTRAQAAN